MDIVKVDTQEDMMKELINTCKKCKKSKCEQGFIISEIFPSVFCRDRDIKIEMKGDK